MFKKVLIANRGEIAVRVIRACKEWGIGTVAVHSDVDADSMHVRLADESVCIGSHQPQNSYLNIAAIMSAVDVTGAEAIHPGYGFLSENIDFAKACVDNNIVFIGPSTEAIQKMGDKVTAIQTAMKAGVPCLPGTYAPVTYAKAKKVCDEIGYPVMVKASAGGGGIGIRKVDSAEDLEESFKQAQSLAESSFGNSKLYVEKYMTNGSHVEVQVLADLHGNAIHLFERDCSVQRRNQKIIEETPCTKLTDQKRKELWNSAIDLVKHINYTNAGTVEFLVDEESNFYFLEMNTRLQVEHPITESIFGVDIVREQIRVAAGLEMTFIQENLSIKGHSIEVRINAEKIPSFAPCPGKITAYHAPGGLGVRTDSAIYVGYVIPPYYDSLIGKLIVRGRDRSEALARLSGALSEIIIDGIDTTIPLFRSLLEEEDIQKGTYNIHWLEKWLDKKFGQNT